MTTSLLRAGALACALLGTTALTTPAMAQSAHTFNQPDANGVDLTYGDFSAAVREGSIGSGEGELALVRSGVWVAGSFPTNGHQWDRIQLSHTSTSDTVVIGMHSDIFSATGASPLGTSLSGSGGAYTYSRADGTQVAFSDPTGSVEASSNFCNGAVGQGDCTLLPGTITSPDGKTVTIDYDVWVQFRGGGLDNAYFARIADVYNSDGYRITFAYSSGGTGGSGTPPSSWYQRTGASFFNDHVSTTTAQASVSYSYPSSGVTQVTDMGGNVWQLTGTSTGLTAIRRPGASSDTTTISYGGTGGTVSSVTRDGVTTSYSRSVSGSTATMTVTDAGSHVTTVVSDLNVGRPTSINDPLSRVTGYTYDSYGRLTRVTAPEGNYVNYTYDSRGNITETRRVAKSGSGLSDIVTSATFASSCTDPSCNEPLTTTDERGNVTDYAYNSTHGGVVSVTAPAPTTGATRPETRYDYTLDTGSGIYRLTSISACATGSTASPTCVGTSDESRMVLTYDANGNISSVEQRSGNTTGSGALSATTAATYDNLGNLLTIDGPLTTVDDITRYRYNSGRQLIGVVEPDPDGASPYVPRARRITYTNGLPTRVEMGTVASQSDTDWAGFTTLLQTDITYDSNARRTRQVLSASSTTYAVTDFSYDALGRPDCTAQRMNPSAWSTTTAACTLQTSGSYGDDRVTRTVYDDAGEVTLVQTGYGVTGVQADEVTTTYRNNGQVETVTDAMGNKTTNVYDGHDRLLQTQYPSTTQGAGTSNSSDYEQLSYATATVGGVSVSTPLISSRRLRNGNSIGYGYDNLGRLVSKDMPGSEPDIAYAYDNLGRLTSAMFSATSQGVTYTFDALGRLTSAASNMGGTTRTLSYQYDLAGNLTQITHPDSAYFTYAHDVLGRATLVREGGVNWLNGFSFNGLGAVTDQSYNATWTTSYGYDAVGRLNAVSHNPSGTAYDLSASLSYNPASQIASRTETNDTYAWGGHYAVNRSYTADGLNRYTAAGSASFTYDSNGNLATDGSNTFTYDSENRLVSVSGGHSATLSYDPFGRLWQITSGSSTTQFLYDGLALAAEYDGSGTMLHRYVHGQGVDMPEVVYDGSSLSSPRFLLADERGSIIGSADGSGGSVSVNTYDEHGIPGASNTGRFQYTGQAWLPEIGMYYYRARMYSPTLGRFLQTDPIGFGGGMNLYAYVQGDPVNFTDPAGLRWIQVCEQTLEGDAGPGGREHCHWENVGGDDDNSVSGDELDFLAGYGGNGSATGGKDFLGGGQGDLGPPIVVTAALGHRYRRLDVVCNRELSQSQMSELNHLFVIPGHEGQWVNSGGPYIVWAGQVPVGFVYTNFTRGGLTATNATTAFHMFVGSITQDIYTFMGRTIMQTYGRGFAGTDLLGQLRDDSNDFFGPKVFGLVHYLASHYAQDHFGGCF